MDKTHAKKNHYDLQADLERIKDAFTETASDVKGKTNELLSQSADALRERSQQACENVADYTSSQPFKALGIALLSGIVIGYLLHK